MTPVQVGHSRWVHARSDYYVNETKCGLQDSYPMIFSATQGPVTCPFCLRAPAA